MFHNICQFNLKNCSGFYDRYSKHFKTGASSPWPPSLTTLKTWLSSAVCGGICEKTTKTDVGWSWKLSGNLWPHLTFYFQAGRLKEPPCCPREKVCYMSWLACRSEVRGACGEGWDWWRVSAQHFIVWKCNSRCSRSLQILIAKFALRLPHPSFLTAHQGDAGATTA